MSLSLLTGCGGAPEAEIYIEPIEGLSEDFVRGMDISSLISEEASGVVYYDEKGKEADLLEVLADAGLNYVRVRVWNDPYDANGNGYGGGNNDVEKAMEIGKRAAKQGIKILVDFHYSDFWADPSKQQAPKAWEGMSIDEKKTAIYDFTKESLEVIIAAGADVGMVQIGNEINYGMAGETSVPNVMALLDQASKAVRDVAAECNQDIKIAVHYTEISDYNFIVGKAIDLRDYKIDYDIFGISYYNYWHGEIDWMQYILGDIHKFFDKEVMILETSYTYTTEPNGDGHPNTIDTGDLVKGYTASVQSQATCIRDIIAAAYEVGASGLFYWEGAWIPVGLDLAANKPIWEEHGSGWAASHAKDYDPDDAGRYFGGCAWENQAMFDYEGHPLESLNVFKYIYTGANCDPAIDYVENCEVSVEPGAALMLPETVPAIYNNRALNKDVPVTWDSAQVAAIDTNQGGRYVVTGAVEGGATVQCKVTVPYSNLVVNPSFEDKDRSMWNITANGSNPTNYQVKAAEATSGDVSLHFWSENAQEFKVEQTLTDLPAGSYGATFSIQGGDVGNDAEIYLYVIVNGQETRSELVTLNGWLDWQEPVISGIKLDGSTPITIGISVKCQGGGWGTMDDVTIYAE